MDIAGSSGKEFTLRESPRRLPDLLRVHQHESPFEFFRRLHSPPIGSKPSADIFSIAL